MQSSTKSKCGRREASLSIEQDLHLKDPNKSIFELMGIFLLASLG